MIKPFNGNLLIKKEVLENKTSSGILLSTTAKDQDNVGKVVAVSAYKMVDGKKTPMEIEVGQTVVFDKYGITELQYQNEDYLLIHEDKVLAVIE